MNPTTQSETQSTGKWGRLAWLPIFLLLAAIIVARVAGLSESYKSETLTLVLSFIFYTLVSLGTLFLIGRSFLASGSPGLLLLECGVVLWSLAGTVGDFVSHGDANINVTIFNIGILLAGLCHLAGAILALNPKRVLRRKAAWLGTGCAFALGALWLVSQAALLGWLPVFFIPGHGGTLVRYAVLISAIAMFVLSAGVLHANQRAARLPFTSWYKLALLLLAVGLFGIMIQLSLGSVVNWLSRTAQWLGGLYLLIAALASLHESHLPLFPVEKKPHPAYYRDAVAVAVVFTAAAIRLTFLSAMGAQSPYVVFFPAVMFAAMYGGLRSGLVATVMSAILTNYFWIEPVNQFKIGHLDDQLSIVIFLLSGGMVAWVTDSMHRARARASAAETQALLAVEHEKAAEALYEGRAKLEAALASMTDAVFISDAQGRFIDFNDAFATYHRFKNKDECFKTLAEYSDILDVFLPDGTLAPLDMWAVPRALRGETVTNAEYTLRRKDTGETWVGSYSFAPICDKDGAIVGSVVAGRDITEIKRAEMEIRRQHKIDEAINRMFEKALTCDTEEELGRMCLSVIEELTGSKFGFIGEIGQDGSLHDIAVSDPGWELCTMYDKTGHRRPLGNFKIHGLYGRVLLDGRSLIANDPSSHPDSIGIPEGHPQLTAFLGVPFTQRGKTIGMVAVGNREKGYTQEQQQDLEVLVPAISQSLLRKRAEEALRQSEQRWATTLASIGDGVIVTDVGGAITFMNGVAEFLTGWTLQEASQVSMTEVFKIINEQTRKEVENPVSKVLRAGNVVGLGNHTLLIRKDGTEVPVDDSGAPVKDESGTISGVVLIFRDITERKRAEAERERLLKEARDAQKLLGADLVAMTKLQKLGTLFVQEGNLEPVLGEIVDAAIAISAADFGNIQLLDAKSSELKIAAHRGFPEWWVAFWNSVSKGQGACGTALDRGERVIVEDVERSPIFIGTPGLEIQLKAGVRAVQSTPLVTRSGKFLGMFSTQYKTPHRPDDRALRLLDLLARQASDIIERAQTEQTLSASEEQFRRAVEDAPIPVIMHAEDGQVLQVSRTWTELTGYTLADVPTVDAWLNRAHGRGADAVRDHVHELFKGHKSVLDLEFPVRTSSGQFRHWNFSASSPGTLQDGRRFVVGMAQDITERKQAEEALKRAYDELEQRVQERTAELEKANQTLRDLSSRLLSVQEEERKRIAGEIHDTLGACLSAIKFKVEAALQHVGETATVETESFRPLIPVIQEGIDECRRLQMDLRPPMLDDLGLLPTLSWFCRRFETIYSAIQIEQEIGIEEAEILNAMKIVIYRVIQEAMNNVAKHSKGDLVRLSLRKMGGKIELALEDNGQGFDLKEVLGSESRKRGLGLTSMRERIELSGGSFSIESTEGRGTTVRGSWPLVGTS